VTTTSATVPPSAPRVLSIAGTDPTGGAGIQADLKTVGALGGYGMAVVTALVAQNTRGVRSVRACPPEFLREQLDAVSDDVVVDAVKTGMLHSAPLVAVVDEWLARTRPPAVVLDPVVVSTSGHRLLDAEAEEAVRALCRRADLVTPNLPELAVLVGEEPARDWEHALDQARQLADAAGTTVLVKGGHLDGDLCPDALVSADGVLQVPGRRVASRSTHGTGCSLSSAMAVLAASGWRWHEALVRAKGWLAGAIEHGEALRVGSGHGPVDHFHELRPALPTASWSAAVWGEVAALREEVDGCAFVTALARGDLDREAFHRYLAQDALYLGEYSRALAVASSLAPAAEEQVFWARSAADALAVEAELHRSRVGDHLPDPAPVTTAYTDHLLAASSRGSYPELVAALLPCFWLYSDVGQRLAAAGHDAHPYRDWLATYADPAFTASTRTAVAVADRAARTASPLERERMRVAFTASVRHELAFFCAPLDGVVGAEPAGT